jgi:UDP-N-acetylglucosamine 2-epimerase (non-hydrolysing)
MVRSEAFSPYLVHTGQHYDASMSEVFFQDLRLPRPDMTLDIGSGTHAEQTARAMLGLEPVLSEIAPDVVVVVGDVNSTLAGAMAAAKLELPLAHVEAGLRSFDRTMPEEINRVVADVLSDFLFAPSRDAIENLRQEGISPERIHFVGNVMIDSMLASLKRAESSQVLEVLDVCPNEYFVATVHRPANVDHPDHLASLVAIFLEVARLRRTVVVAHPRTARRLAESGERQRLDAGGVQVIEPLGYLDFLKLMANATAMLTDSGGIQEESTVLGIPCITLRDRTERPITVAEGTNRITGLDQQAVLQAARDALQRRSPPVQPELWDGHASQRIVDVLISQLSPE